MGEYRYHKCRNCGNFWKHFMGVGFLLEPIKGSREWNTTGDADEIIRCPKCDSTDFCFDPDAVDGLWD